MAPHNGKDFLAIAINFPSGLDQHILLPAKLGSNRHILSPPALAGARPFLSPPRPLLHIYDLWLQFPSYGRTFGALTAPAGWLACKVYGTLKGE